MLVYEERRKPFVDALNEVMGRFKSDKMALIIERNNKPFILHILNLRVN
jgi:hypothetical protein